MRSLFDLDVSLFRALNAFCGTSDTLDRLFYHAAALTGVLFLGIFGLLWFRADEGELQRREKLFMVIPAVAIALIINRTISTLLPFRVRPMYEFSVNLPTYPWQFDLEHWSSFPSDNATYLFAITACVWAASRLAGAFFGLFSACVVIGRVYFGIHYPSDILAGTLLGLAVGFVASRDAVRARVARPLLLYEKDKTPYFYGLLFMVLAEVVAGFPNTRHLGVAIVHLFKGYGGT